MLALTNMADVLAEKGLPTPDRKLEIQPLSDNTRELIEEIKNPEKIRSLDTLLLAQLYENLRQPDAQEFMTTFDGEKAFGLPVEFREIRGRFHAFIPRVQSWYFRRNPVPGEHPPLDETYGFERHIFVSKFEELVGEDREKFFAGNKHVVIGGLTESFRTPYHRFYWTSEGAIIELYSKPSLRQQQKLEEFKNRVNTLVPLKIVLHRDEESLEMPELEETIEGIDLSNLWATAEASHVPPFTKRSHQVVLTPENELTVMTFPKPQTSEMIYGFGFIDGQLDEGDKRNSMPLERVEFYIDTNAANHSQALGGFVLDRVAQERDRKAYHQDPKSYEAQNLNFLKTRMKLEDELPEFQKLMLPDKWQYRKEIVENPLPFIVNLQGWEIPAGFRLMINKTTAELTVEVLTDTQSFQNQHTKALLEKVADKLSQSLLEEGNIYFPKSTKLGGLEIKKRTSKVLPVHQPG